MSFNRAVKALDVHMNAILGSERTGNLLTDLFLFDDKLDALRKEQEEQDKAEMFASDKADAEYYVTEEFRQEVMDEIIAEGATPLQAQGRTRDQFRTFQEAQRLGLM